MTEQLTEDKETAILQAARKRFAYYGFSKVTMDEIASDVAMGKASLYYYYPTKEKLLQAVLLHEKDHFLAEIQVILHAEDRASDKLRKYADKRFELFKELANLSMLSFARLGEVRNTFGELFAELEKQEVKVVHQILQEGKRAGEFAITNLQQTAELIPHALQGLRFRAIKKKDGDRLDDSAYDALRQEGKLLVDHLLKGIQK